MINVAIIGYGNVGKAVYEAVLHEKDMQLAGIVSASGATALCPVVKTIDELTQVDVAVICVPSRLVNDTAAALLAKGISTVDCNDIHADIYEVRSRLDAIAKQHGTKAIISAGWDPGTDSIIRALAEAMAPRGITYTNFGPGMSMGHTAVVKAVPGVRDALSLTIPTGSGIHRRMVYVQLEDGADFAKISQAIQQDSYFIHDETHVKQVDDISALKDEGHRVSIARKGVSASACNQNIEFNMSINNPALTGQIMVSSVRAVTRQAPGCYTMIEIPPIDYLYGDKETLIHRLV